MFVLDEMALDGRVARKIEVNGNNTVLTLDDGSKVTLTGTPTPLELNGPRCTLCGTPAQAYPLFTLDDVHYLCSDCAALAVRTFMANNVPINLTGGTGNA